MDAVYELLKGVSARDLTMEAVAKKANVGKPTLYKWWPSKAALITAMFHERLSRQPEVTKATSAEASLRAKMKRLIHECNGLFGKVVADLIAEGQSDPSVLKALYDNHVRHRRASVVADVKVGIASGEFSEKTDPELMVDAMFAPVYYRLLLRFAPLTETYGNQLIDQALRWVKTSPSSKQKHK